MSDSLWVALLCALHQPCLPVAAAGSHVWPADVLPLQSSTSARGISSSAMH
jgi:hypothetical protein